MSFHDRNLLLRATSEVRYTQTGCCHVRFSNRPSGVKHFQTVRCCSVDVKILGVACGEEHGAALA